MWLECQNGGSNFDPIINSDPDAASLEIQPIRYAEQVIIHVELRTDKKVGQIYPPYIEVTYATASSDDYDKDNHARVRLPSIPRFCLLSADDMDKVKPVL